MGGAPKSEKIWLNGKLIDWDAARVHLMTHTLHYGLGVFEGVRCYRTDRGGAIFRARDHSARLIDSAKIVGLKLDYSAEQIDQAMIETIKVNDLTECYIRPLVYLGDETRGLNIKGASTHMAIAVWPWGAYLGEEALESGINIATSSFTRHHPNIYMTKAKVCGAYVNSILAKREALENGFDEALLLDPSGYVAEGSGENIFIARDGKLLTPPPTSILDGITRASVIEIARSIGIETKEAFFGRDEVYRAEEAFFTGTAAELTPIRSLDRRVIGSGRRGPITTKLQKIYFDLLRGKGQKRFLDWLTFV